LNPQVVLLSVTAGDRDGSPSPETIEVLEGYILLCTDHKGWIPFSIDGGEMWLEVERNKQGDDMTDFGVMFRCQKPPETLSEYVQNVERAGFDEVWIVEDCFFAGGIASTAMALAHTQHIRVGLGIVPSVARNAAFTAMEFATLARLYPGRFLPGIGHGVGAWMKQIGAYPRSQLAALGEVTQAVQFLLHGEEVTMDGVHVHLKKVKLEFPPQVVPPIQLGVRGPKSLLLSGRCADGTILAEGAAPSYLKWAKEQITAGQAQAGRFDHHRLTVYVWTRIGDRKDRTRAVIRPILADTLPHVSVQLKPLGIHDELFQLLEEHGELGFAEAIPDHWLDQLTVSGTPEDCAESVIRFKDASADAVIFILPFDDELEQVRHLQDELLPLVKS
jgi:alkanesulfonate monooxygenase SsuD/methylene tetrahydromethanopterin reductase-like flavin-dependent oxidoreductase (luciferase family)